MTNESVLLQDLRHGQCSSGLCKQLRSVAADEIERLRGDLEHKDAYYAQFNLVSKGNASEPNERWEDGEIIVRNGTRFVLTKVGPAEKSGE